MNKHAFLVGIILFFAASANAIILIDDFSGDSNNIKILSDTNLSDVTSFDQDANQPTTKATQANGFSLNFIDLNSIYIPVDVDKDAGNAARIIIRLDQNFNISDYNQNGRIHFGLWIDGNAGGSGARIDLRLGTSTSNYFEYRRMFAEEGSWWLGRHDIIYDLNQADAIAGTPNMNDINMAWIIYNHAVSPTDFNFSINGIWVEKGTNFTGGTWDIAKPAENPQGMGIIDQNRLVLNNLDRLSYGYHGRIFANAFDSINLGNHQIDLIMDVNVIDSNWGTRLLFDYIDGQNFSACFIAYITPTSVRYGIEQWVNNVRTFTQTSATSAYGVSKQIRCKSSREDGKIITMYIDGSEVINTEILSRNDGRIGIETFSNCSQCNGKIRIDNVNFSATQFPITAGIIAPLLNIVRNFVFPIIMLMIFLYTFTRPGDIKSKITFSLLLLLLYVAFDTLFFGTAI